MDLVQRRNSAEDEPPRRPASDEQLGFVRRPMVRWLDPHQLVDTAGRVLASGFSMSYTDSRQMQALYPCQVTDRSDASELWIDYVSDLGDGWNSTFTVASLLSQDELELSCDDEVHRLRRGAVLVMGGDQVVPGAHPHRVPEPVSGALSGGHAAPSPRARA